MKEFILIVGGQLQNKGAQAMTFTLVNSLKLKYPDKKIVMLSSVYDENDHKNKKKYDFSIYPWSIRDQIKVLGPRASKYYGIKSTIKPLIFNKTNLTKQEVKKIRDIFSKSFMMIDISGYALSSQRGEHATLKYLVNINLAEAYDIPIVLYPQSFGPFNFAKSELVNLVEESLKYPLKIYAREEDGIKKLSKLGIIENVEKSFDSVLIRKSEISPNIIYKKPELESNFLLDIEAEAVGIVPNEKIIKHGKQMNIYSLYEKIIRMLIDNNKTVYLLRHSTEDYQICKNIKDKFKNEKKVVLVHEDLNCIELENLISKFNFIIASRYHSIIHAYKRTVPCFVIGWAIKYEELLDYFDQKKYLIDVREELHEQRIVDKIKALNKNYKLESKTIEEKLNQIEQDDLLDIKV